jgi:hypothetical protein
VLSDFVDDDTGTCAGGSPDKRTFAATSKRANQSSAGSRAADSLGSIVVTLVVGVLGCLSPLVFTLGDLLRPSMRKGPTL